MSGTLEPLKIRILGSAAGGGFPQWNCNCFNCKGLRDGTIRAVRRTQSSIAVTDNGEDWVLINASPDILTQLHATPGMHPERAVRDSGIAAVLLMDAQIDHVAGLLMLREKTSPLPLYATAPVLADLSKGLPLVPVLNHYCGTAYREIPLARTFEISPLEGIGWHAVPLDSKAPPYSPHRNDPHPGDNIGLLIQSKKSGRRVFYAPGLGGIDSAVRAVMQSADVLLVDGTFWLADEMIRHGLSNKTAADMGHLPQSGAHGMIALLDSMPASRKILIHINNTNPILRDDSEERAELTHHGVEVAYDGLEIAL